MLPLFSDEEYKRMIAGMVVEKLKDLSVITEMSLLMT